MSNNKHREGFIPPLQKSFIADLDELEHAKKVVKMSKFWDDAPHP